MNSFFLLISYCVLATLVTIINKYILLALSQYITGGSLFILFLQSLISLGLLHEAKVHKILTYRSINYNYLQTCVPIIGLLILSIYSNGKSINLLPLSTFNILKNIGTILVVIGDVMCFGKVMYTSTWLAFFLIILSNFYNNFNNEKSNNNFEGYAWAIVNCVSCALYSLYVKYHRKVYPDITNVEYVYYNTILTTPILALLSLSFDGVQCIYTILRICYYNDFFVILLIFSSVCTLSLTIVIACIYKIVSPTTYAIVGSANKLLITTTSVLVFSDEVELRQLNSKTIFGVIISVIAGIYAIVYA